MLGNGAIEVKKTVRSKRDGFAYGLFRMGDDEMVSAYVDIA